MASCDDVAEQFKNAYHDRRDATLIRVISARSMHRNERRR
jgi:uncharacterized DUF497 family protein